MRALAVLMIAVGLVACSAEDSQMRSLVGKPEYATAGQDYRIVVTDNPAARQFDLEFTSMSERDLCLGLDWPDELGRLSMGAEYVTLRVADRTFPMSSAEVVYMSLDPIQVSPGATLAGLIAYDQFPQDAFDIDGERTLEVRTSAHFCDTADRITEITQ